MKRIIFVLMFLLLVGVVNGAVDNWAWIAETTYGMDEGDTLKVGSFEFVTINGYKIIAPVETMIRFNDDYLILDVNTIYSSSKFISFSYRSINFESISVSFSPQDCDVTNPCSFKLYLPNKNQQTAEQGFKLVSESDFKFDFEGSYNNEFLGLTSFYLTKNDEFLINNIEDDKINVEVLLNDGGNNIEICGKKQFDVGDSGSIGDGTKFGAAISLITIGESDDKQKCEVTSCEYYGNPVTNGPMAKLWCNTESPRFEITELADLSTKSPLKFYVDSWTCDNCVTNDAVFKLYPISEQSEFLELINNKFGYYNVGSTSEINDDVLNADQFYIGGNSVYLVDPSDDKAMFEKGSLKVILTGGTLKLSSVDGLKKMNFKDDGEYKIDVTTNTGLTSINYVDCCTKPVSFSSEKDSEGYPKAYACNSVSDKGKLFGLLPDFKEYSVGDQNVCMAIATDATATDATATKDTVTDDNDVQCGSCTFDKTKTYFGYSTTNEPKFYFFSEIALSYSSDYSRFGSGIKGENIKDIYCENIVCSEPEFINNAKSSVSVTSLSSSLSDSKVCGNTEETKGWSCSCPMANDNYNLGGIEDYLNHLWTPKDCKDDPECTAGLCNGVGYDPYYCCSDTAKDIGGSVDISEREDNPFRKAGVVSSYVSEGGLCEVVNTYACLSSDPYLLKNDEVAICSSLLEWKKSSECPEDTICDPMSCVDTYDLDTCCKPISTISESDPVNDLISEGASCEGFDEDDLSCSLGNRRVLSCKYDNSDPGNLIWTKEKNCNSDEICKSDYCMTADSSEECCFSLDEVEKVKSSEDVELDLSLEACTDSAQCIVKYGLNAFCMPGNLGSPDYCYAGQCKNDNDCYGTGTCNVPRGICESYPLCLSDETCSEYLGSGFVCGDNDHCVKGMVSPPVSLYEEPVPSEGDYCSVEGVVSCYGDDVLKCSLNNLDDLEWTIVEGLCAENEYCNPSTCIESEEECCFEQTCNDDTDCYNSLGIGYECDGRYCKSKELSCILNKDCDEGETCESGICIGECTEAEIIDGTCDTSTDTTICEDLGTFACDSRTGKFDICSASSDGNIWKTTDYYNCNPERCDISKCSKSNPTDDYSTCCNIPVEVDDVSCDLDSDCEDGYACDLETNTCFSSCDTSAECSSDAACDITSDECVVCTDSDDELNRGLNDITFGEVEGIELINNKFISTNDVCLKNGRLTEMYCTKQGSNTYAYNKVVSCSSGYSCSDGVCISDSDVDTTIDVCEIDSDCDENQLCYEDECLDVEETNLETYTFECCSADLLNGENVYVENGDCGRSISGNVVDLNYCNSDYDTLSICTDYNNQYYLQDSSNCIVNLGVLFYSDKFECEAFDRDNVVDCTIITDTGRVVAAPEQEQKSLFDWIFKAELTKKLI